MPKSPQPSDLHEWISFEDPDEDRTWVIDATFLLSSWTCIYGRGCQGILSDDATELEQGCCSYGAHFLDDDDVATVKSSSARLTDDQWQFKKVAQKIGWLDTDPDTGDQVTRVHEDACIFLNRPGFSAGAGCALHVGALAAGERPMDWKPDVCWQVPVRLQETTDEDGHVVTFVREWKRRDWGDGGHEFHWWCTNDKAAFVGSDPTYKYLKHELTELVGAPVYALLVAELEKRSKNVAPHPVTITKKRTAAKRS